ncbi:isochorismate synthase [Tsukamurella sp. 8F]|uniref:isochorismate synthase n=1 Tax=unclassified Tsukamurella TaxID=2633480 RepID=UPI0023B953FA|nr:MULTISPECIES: isochorismate synthase [unclassified Tsukamurella]MDF0530934.1 isochorismate synthase [Tsukamurella sp. 8J]MDF0588259.1 isochorismate synthase [Tsukamurella sp. 8F]
MRFALSRPGRSVSAEGAEATFSDPRAASAALKAGRAGLVVGALPFDHDDPAALIIPADATFRSGPLQLPPGRRLPTFTRRDVTTREQHRAAVAAAVERIDSGELEKVVLARAIELRADGDIDPAEVARRLLAGSQDGDAYLADLSPAGPAYEGAVLAGSMPESLVRVDGAHLSCAPFAGTAPRGATPGADRAAADDLFSSAKDRAEHAYVVDWIAERLAPLCRDLQVPAEPSLHSTPQVWHLSTPIRGTLANAATALDVALALYPTPAVCGTPSDTARSVISELEGPRGFYGGAVGWADSDGNGEWMVALRCAELRPEWGTVRAWAGGGIVGASDPDAEYDETTAKFGTVLHALGL